MVRYMMSACHHVVGQVSETSEFETYANSSTGSMNALDRGANKKRIP